jgi:GTP-binding protein Era
MKKPETSGFRSAFIAFVGRPNSGKSTLLNTILGENLSIVTPMPQTTQRNMRGIYNGDGYQLVFVDTPGIHKGRHKLNRSMYHQSTGIIRDAGIDLLCYLVDISRRYGTEEDDIAEMIGALKIPVCIIFNKTDLCKDEKNAVNSFFIRYPTLKSFPWIALSAISPKAKKSYLKLIEPFVPVGPRFYPDENITDSNLRFFAAEYIRKQVITNTFEEVPHAACVEILDYKEFENRHVITATIHVETRGQKGIVIGKKGKVIEKIKRQSQKELGQLAGVPVSITCHVKVSPKWRDNKQFLTSMGLDMK